MHNWVKCSNERISIHALREEGDGRTPWRHTKRTISIHALREEGDYSALLTVRFSFNFYPRPPRGGRRHQRERTPLFCTFLSTPSARRATRRHRGHPGEPGISIHALREEGDQQRIGGEKAMSISIHALREEGDWCWCLCRATPSLFLSTPSARGATGMPLGVEPSQQISIHALREEGDAADCAVAQLNGCISIHALREEGDAVTVLEMSSISVFLSTPSARRATPDRPLYPPGGSHFYPRPPRGGRRGAAWFQFCRPAISIHALREEGDWPPLSWRR